VAERLKQPAPSLPVERLPFQVMWIEVVMEERHQLRYGTRGGPPPLPSGRRSASKDVRGLGLGERS
jgi:hypothetical protein